MAAPAQLPGGIIYNNILPRLPYRALMRLTAVCKAWRLIICSNDGFAAAQARTPSSASVDIARCIRGSLEILSPWAADVVPRDPFFSLVEVDHRRLSFSACTSGVVCLMEHPDPNDDEHWQRWPGRDRAQWRRYVCNFYVVNPNLTTHGICRVPYHYAGEVATAGLAYDPETAPREGFQLVVPVVEDGGLCRFRRFTSLRDEWSSSREALALPPLQEFKPKAVYANRGVHWLAGDVVVWYDLDGDLAGTMPLLPAPGSWSLEVRDYGGIVDIGAWRGRLRLAHVNTFGVSVWELAGGERWDWKNVHFQLWEKVPGLICPRSSWTCVRWKLETVEMEAGGEEAVCVVLTMVREDDGAASSPSTWRGLLRYDVRTGAARSVLELAEHEKIGPLVDYHSSMAKLPDITLVEGIHE